MKNKICLSLILLSLFGCSEPKNNIADPALESIQLPNEIQAESQSDQRFIYENFPNAKTTTLNIEVNEPLNDQQPIKNFRARLLKDKFQLSQRKIDQAWSTNDCHLNRIIRVTGQGVASYRASSRVGIGENKDYFPDFDLIVMNFETIQKADQHFKTLAEPINSHEFCNGKSPEKLVKNGDLIFYFTTRAEMFRGYINQYAEIVKAYQ